MEIALPLPATLPEAYPVVAGLAVKELPLSRLQMDAERVFGRHFCTKTVKAHMEAERYLALKRASIWLRTFRHFTWYADQVIKLMYLLRHDRRAQPLCLLVDRAEALDWHRTHIDETIRLNAPQNGICLLAAFRREMQEAGRHVDIFVHTMGPDPWFEGVEHLEDGSVDQAFLYGWMDHRTELRQVNGRIMAVPIAA